MLPIPIFLLLVFSVAIVAPAPAILIHLMKTISLPAPPSPFLTLPTLPSTFIPPAEETQYLPAPGPQLTLDIASVCHGQSIVDMAPNSTTPLLQPHGAHGYTTHATILPVVVLAMFNCLVYRLLVDDTNGTRSEEGSEQSMPCQPSHLVPILSEEPICYHTIHEIPSPRPFIETNILTTGSSELNGLSDMVMATSCLELGPGTQSIALFERYSRFPGGLSYGALAGDSEKATSHDSSVAILSVSDCTPCDDWTQMAHSTDSDEPGSAPIALVAAIKYSEFVPSQCVPGIGAMKTGVILSSAPLSQEPEPERHGEPQDSSTLLSTIIESACDVNGVHQASLSYDPEGDDDDETFDYKGIDWEPRASGVPTPPPSSEICTIALPCSSPEPRFKHSRAPLKSQNESMSRSLSTSPREPALQSSTMYALDDIQVGVKCKNEAEVAYSTRRRFKRASADDLRAMIGLVQATPFPVPDCGPVTPLHNVTDKGIAIKEVALLREDLPIFTARTSAIGQEVASFAGPPQPVFAGLRASIHAPRNDDLSRTELQEYVGTSDSAYEKQASSFPTESQTRSHSPDLVSTADEIQVSTHSAPKPGSQEYTNPATLESSTSQTSRLESSTIAPADADATVIQTRKEPVETLVPPTIVGPNVLRGLAASIHAPQGCPSNQAKRERAVHSADAPNWATAAREDSMAASRGSSPAQLGNTPNQRLDDGDEPDVPTATRCAIQDENEGSGVDDSDGSMRLADDRDGAACSYETDSGLDATDDLNEQESATRSRRSRRRGKPRRPRTKVPYLPPPRMRNLTQHPAAEVFVDARALHKLAAGPVGQNLSHTLPHQHPSSISGSIIPPQADQLGQPLVYRQTPQQYMGSPSMADHFQLSHISTLQSLTPPAPYYPIFYTQNPQGERATPLMP